MSNDYLELTYQSISCFANDGKLLPDELDKLTTIVLRDGVVDENEKRVLNNIFGRLKPEELTPQMLERIATIKAKYR